MKKSKDSKTTNSADVMIRNFLESRDIGGMMTKLYICYKKLVYTSFTYFGDKLLSKGVSAGFEIESVLEKEVQ